MLFHRKAKIPKPQIPQLSPELSDKVRTMPLRFQFEKQEKKKGYGKLFLFLFLFIFFIILGEVTLIIFVGQYRTTSLNSASPEGEDTKNLEATPSPTATPPPTPNPEAEAPSEDSSEILPPNGPITNTDVSFPQPTPTPEIQASPADNSLDTSDIDLDNLSGEEEILFATNSNSSDTDADGYSDANELLAGYDPRVSKKTLIESGLVSQYTLAERASVVYPNSWLVKTADTLYIFDSKKGDSISIAFSENQKGQDPIEWISQNDLTVIAEQIVPVELLSRIKAFRTEDNLKYYVFSADQKNVFTFSYHPSIFTSLPFLTTFQMMVNNFKF